MEKESGCEQPASEIGFNGRPKTRPPARWIEVPAPAPNQPQYHTKSEPAHPVPSVVERGNFLLPRQRGESAERERGRAQGTPSCKEV